MPTFTALFAHSSRKIFSDCCPTLRTMLLDQLQDSPVFLFCPRTFDNLDLIASLKEINLICSYLIAERRGFLLFIGWFLFRFVFIIAVV